MELVKRLKASPDYADIRVSPLLIVARAVIWAVRRTPMVNAAWIDAEGGAEIRVRHYVNLGIAAATPRGLLVPNMHPVDATLDGAARFTNRINDRVKRVTDDAVDPSHPRIEELLDELFGNIHERDLRGTDDI